MTTQLTFYVQDYAQALSWYSHFLNQIPSYVDDTWAVFEKEGVKFCLINKSGVRVTQTLAQLGLFSQQPDQTLDAANQNEVMKEQSGDEEITSAALPAITVRWVPITIH